MTLQRPPPPTAAANASFSSCQDASEHATTALAPARGADQPHASRRRAAAAANASLSILAAPSLDHTRAIRHQRRARARRRSGSRRRARTPCAPMREPSAQPPRSPPRAAPTSSMPAAAEQPPPRTRPARNSPRHHSITHEPSGTNVEHERDVAAAAAAERAHLARRCASRARNHRARARVRQPPPSSRRRERIPLDTRRAITRSHMSHPAPTPRTSETSQRPPPPSAHTLRADARAGRATLALAPTRGVGQPHASHRVSVAIQTLPPRYDQAMTAQCAHSARQSVSRARNPRARARARRRPAHSRPPPSSCLRKGTLLDNLRAIT